MMCVICKMGETHNGKVTVTLERNGATLIFKGVPAIVCLNCGEEFVDEKTTSVLLHAGGQAAQAGVQVDVREYIAA